MSVPKYPSLMEHSQPEVDSKSYPEVVVSKYPSLIEYSQPEVDSNSYPEAVVS
jgi:hypothetical protein